VFGLEFSNPVGLAAGFDKNAQAIDALLAMGFGFIEVGAVTPKAQPGNPKPHVRRLKSSENIVNACGFNNFGVDYVVEKLKRRQLPGVVGVNVGKNKSTPNERAVEDYLICMQRVYAYADFITINISSPNTAGLRDLHQADTLNDLLRPLYTERESLAKLHKKTVPLLLKLSPDLDDESIAQVVAACSRHQFDGIIATNTSLQHNLLPGLAEKRLPGGLSGPVIAPLSYRVLQQIQLANVDSLPVISVGGIDNAVEARKRFDSGAALVQVYTALVYQGRGIIRRLIESL
jgi:dihydroorotate dehydrogenase